MNKGPVRLALDIIKVNDCANEPQATRAAPYHIFSCKSIRKSVKVTKLYYLAHEIFHELVETFIETILTLSFVSKKSRKVDFIEEEVAEGNVDFSPFVLRAN